MCSNLELGPKDKNKGYERSFMISSSLNESRNDQEFEKVKAKPRTKNFYQFQSILFYLLFQY